MRKEVLIAIAIGFTVGLAATFGLYRVRQGQALPLGEFVSPLTEGGTTTDSRPANNFTGPHAISLISPLDQSLHKESRVTVAGVTSPFSWVTVLSEKGEKVVQADEQGNFETEIALISGENEIDLQSSSEDGEKASKLITVVYSTVEI